MNRSHSTSQPYYLSADKNRKVHSSTWCHTARKRQSQELIDVFLLWHWLFHRHATLERSSEIHRVLCPWRVASLSPPGKGFTFQGKIPGEQWLAPFSNGVPAGGVANLLSVILNQETSVAWKCVGWVEAAIPVVAFVNLIPGLG